VVSQAWIDAWDAPVIVDDIEHRPHFETAREWLEREQAASEGAN
jgi:hypothetical protein